MVLCEKDIIYWINNFVWTFDPRCNPSYIPMILFPVQEEFIHFIQECQLMKADAIVEKSRDMGVTWLAICFLVHGWLFKDGFKGAIGSRKEDLVDKADDPDSIFEKIRMLLDKLPRWMMPKGYNRDKHDKHLNIHNPEKGSTITGEAGDNMGRGGRSGTYVVDEHAFIERANKVDAALSQNTDFRIYISTPNGNGNAFAQKRRAAAKSKTGHLRLFSMHWKRDPRKNYWRLLNPDGSIFAEGNGEGPADAEYPWYERQKEIINDDTIVAQELDIDYTASIEGIVIPAKYVAAAIDLDQWLESYVGIKFPTEDPIAGYDVAEEGSNKNVCMFRQGPRVFDIKSWNKTEPHLSAVKVVTMCHTRRVKRLNYDADGPGISITTSLRHGNLCPQFEYYGVKNGGRASNKRWPDGKDKGKLGRDKFKNARAENLWELRQRFERTYEYRVLGVKHDLASLISIPDHTILIDQLSSITCETGDDGKIKVESKKDMKKRGVKSPDYADALVFAFVEKRIPPPSLSMTVSQESW